MPGARSFKKSKNFSKFLKNFQKIFFEKYFFENLANKIFPDKVHYNKIQDHHPHNNARAFLCGGGELFPVPHEAQFLAKSPFEDGATGAACRPSYSLHQTWPKSYVLFPAPRFNDAAVVG